VRCLTQAASEGPEAVVPDGLLAEQARSRRGGQVRWVSPAKLAALGTLAGREAEPGSSSAGGGPSALAGIRGRAQGGSEFRRAGAIGLRVELEGNCE
jgi:hypothetical protein